MLKDVTIYSDGACVGNPGPGGYGVVLLFEDTRKELSCGYVRTTNNRMELLGAITGLEALKYRCRVMLVTDSQYVINGIRQGWAEAWRKRGWKRKTKDVPNADLWQRLLSCCEKHEVKWRWVRGHTGVPENERADSLAMNAAQSNDLAPDHGYRGRTDAVENTSDTNTDIAEQDAHWAGIRAELKARNAKGADGAA